MTRVRTGRSVRPFQLPPCISFDDRRKLEAAVVKALLKMEGDLKGDYFPHQEVRATRRTMTMAEACLPAQTPMAEALTFVAPEAYPVSGERMPLNTIRFDELSLVLYRLVSFRLVSMMQTLQNLI